jgi:stringent starvation protein B
MTDKTEADEIDLSNLKVMRFINGHLIIAYLAAVDQKNGMITLERPYTICFNVDLSTGEDFIYLAHFMLLTDNKSVNIPIAQILAVSNPDEEGVARWVEQVKMDLEAEQENEPHTALELSVVSSNDNPEPSDKPRPELRLVKPEKPTIH